MNKEFTILQNMIESLKASGKVRLKRSEFRYYDKAVTEELLAQIHPVKIDEEVLDFYRRIDFVDIQWHADEGAQWEYLDKDTDFVEGHVNIPPFAKLVETMKANNPASLIDPYHALDDKQFEQLKNHVPFDLLNGDGAVTFLLKDGQVRDELHYVSLGNENFIKPLAITAKDYLLKGATSYFFHNWQKALLLGDEKVEDQVKHYLKQLKNEHL